MIWLFLFGALVLALTLPATPVAFFSFGFYTGAGLALVVARRLLRAAG